MTKRIIITSFVILFILGLALLTRLVFFDKVFENSNPHLVGSVTNGTGTISCGKGKVCVAEDGKMEIKKVTGKTLAYLQHACDDPRQCPTPAPAAISAAVALIRAFANNPTLKVTPVPSNPSSGITYYCTSEGVCYAVDTKTNKVISVLEKGPTITPDPRSNFIKKVHN